MYSTRYKENKPMNTKKILAKTHFIHPYDPITHLHLLLKGSILIRSDLFELSISSPTILGLIDFEEKTHSFDYIALEDSVVEQIPFKQHDELFQILRNNPTLSNVLYKSALSQILNLLEVCFFKSFECENIYHFVIDLSNTYLDICNEYQMPYKKLPNLESIIPYISEDPLPDWLEPYYQSMLSIDASKDTNSLCNDPYYLYGFLMKISKDLQFIYQELNQQTEYIRSMSQFLMNENQLDYFDIFSSLLFKAMQEGRDTSPLLSSLSKQIIFTQDLKPLESIFNNRLALYKQQYQHFESLQQSFFDDLSIPFEKKEYENALSQILHFSDCSSSFSTEFTEKIQLYKEQLRSNSRTELYQSTRRYLEKQFYNLYLLVFVNSLSTNPIPNTIRMFLNFGFLDEELAGKNTSQFLLDIVNNFKGNPDKQVFTMYEWLLCIYNGVREPSRSDLDLDYTMYLNEMKSKGTINEEKYQKLLTNPVNRVEYELHNMIPRASKIVSGNILSFCPILSDDTIIKPLDQCLLNYESILMELDKILQLDYSAFWKESLYANPNSSISKETVTTISYPDIILLPVIGNRGSMWQTTGTKQRVSPSRMLLPTFIASSLQLSLLQMVGEYRYDFCRLIQGAHWSNISFPSLTSEYSDFLQFYKKNHDLSTDTKNKIRLSLQKYKNNYKDLFVQDYITYMVYESTGAIRLNKIVRKILFTYCPFSPQIQSSLSAHPLYEDLIKRRSVLTQKELTRLDNLLVKVRQSSKPIPDEINNQVLLLKQFHYTTKNG